MLLPGIVRPFPARQDVVGTARAVLTSGAAAALSQRKAALARIKSGRKELIKRSALANARTFAAATSRPQSGLPHVRKPPTPVHFRIGAEGDMAPSNRGASRRNTQYTHCPNCVDRSHCRSAGGRPLFNRSYRSANTV